jgi:hypothetical protein
VGKLVGVGCMVALLLLLLLLLLCEELLHDSRRGCDVRMLRRRRRVILHGCSVMLLRARMQRACARRRGGRISCRRGLHGVMRLSGERFTWEGVHRGRTGVDSLLMLLCLRLCLRQCCLGGRHKRRCLQAGQSTHLRLRESILSYIDRELTTNGEFQLLTQEEDMEDQSATVRRQQIVLCREGRDILVEERNRLENRRRGLVTSRERGNWR